MESSDFSLGDTVSGEVTEMWRVKNLKMTNSEVMGFFKWTILSLEFCLCLLAYVFLVTDEPGRR